MKTIKKHVSYLVLAIFQKKDESLEKTKAATAAAVNDNSSWLQAWSRSMTQNNMDAKKKSKVPNMSIANERIPKISKDKLNQLLKLYESARSVEDDAASESPLSDVELDEN